MAVGAVAAVLAAGLDSPAGGSITDERLYLGVLADLRAHGAWFTPTLDGVPDFTKPPLLYWAGLLSLAAFGPSLWAARLPVALSALLLALTAGRLARRWGGQAAAVRGLLLCGTCLGVLRYGRLFMMDIPLALTVALGIEAALAAVEEERPWLLLGSGLAAGAAALLKGPVGPCLIGGVALVLLLARARWMLRTPTVPAAVAVAGLVAVPWFVAMTAVHGRPFWERFLLVEHL
ncbi:MAG TPA: glycosyltransferase family 39 protein, partial [Myxococcaceae bacterium]|nr:glycosyltransferase family 39 protein [Myxococcaceae bacterium]